MSKGVKLFVTKDLTIKAIFESLHNLHRMGNLSFNILKLKFSDGFVLRDVIPDSITITSEITIEGVDINKNVTFIGNGSFIFENEKKESMQCSLCKFSGIAHLLIETTETETFLVAEISDNKILVSYE